MSDVCLSLFGRHASSTGSFPVCLMAESRVVISNRLQMITESQCV